MERIGRRRCKGACPGDKELGVPARRGIAAFMSAYALPALPLMLLPITNSYCLARRKSRSHHLTAETALPGWGERTAWSRRVVGYAISRSIDALVPFREQFCRPPPGPHTARRRLEAARVWAIAIIASFTLRPASIDEIRPRPLATRTCSR